jgi:hypothetical protein
MNEDRISQLSKRFRNHNAGKSVISTRARERRSFYLDTDLVSRLDEVYRQINHELYPKHISKSSFLETLMQHGLEHLADLKKALADTSELEDLSPAS